MKVEVKKNKYIMLVEDDETVGSETVGLIKKILNLTEFDVIWAKNGLEALALYHKKKSWFGLKQNKIKCIILDLRLPEMEGPEFIKKLREIEDKNRFSKYTPVVFLTAYDDDEKRKAAMNFFVSAYLKKPIDINTLRNVLWKILRDNASGAMAQATKEESREKLENKQ